MPDINYEVEYDNRARVPEHPEIFARWTREAEDYRAETLKAGRAEFGLSYGDTPRQIARSVLSGGGRGRAGCDVRARRLVALARSFAVQPDGARAQCPRRHCRRRRLRSVSQCRHRRHHRPDPPRLRVHVAALQSAAISGRPFRRRSSHRRHGGDRLAVALSQGAGGPGAGWLRDFGRVRSRAADRHQCQSGSQTRRGFGARTLAALLAGPAGAGLRRRLRRTRIERVQAAEPCAGGSLGQGRRQDAVRRDRRHQPFHRDRSARRSAKRNDGAGRGTRAAIKP